MIERENSPYLVSEIELIYRSQIDTHNRPQIRCSKDAYQIFRQAWNSDKIDLLEESKALMLDNSNRVLGIYRLSSGGITGTVVDTRLLFAAALKANATSIVLAHNHPSANLTPNNADIQLTGKLKAVGQVMDIKLLDHLIITQNNYYSFADEQGFPIAMAEANRPAPDLTP